MRFTSRRAFVSTLGVATVGGLVFARSRALAGAYAGPRVAVVGVIPTATDVISGAA